MFLHLNIKVFSGSFIFLIYLFFIINNSYSQNIEIRYGEGERDERNRSLIMIENGSLFMAGFTPPLDGSSSMNFVLSRLNAQLIPEIIWEIGTEYADFSYSLCYTDGAIYLAGESQEFNETNALIIKSDTSGNIQWVKTLGKNNGVSEMIKSIVPDGYGHFWACGYQSDTSILGSGNDLWILKLDTAGNILIQKTFGSGENDYAQAVKPAEDGGCWVLGDTKEQGNYDVCLYRLDAQGNEIWKRTYGDIFDDGSQDMFLTPGGDWLILGESVPSLNEPFDFLFIKVDSSNGNAHWERRGGGIHGDAAFSGAAVSDNKYLFTGYSHSYTPGPLKLITGIIDSMGNLLDVKTFGGDGLNLGYQLIPYTSNRFAITGFVSDSLPDFYVLITDETGTFLFNPEISYAPPSLYPNPVISGEILRIKETEDIQNLRLFTIQGIEIAVKFNMETLEVILPNELPQAVYLLKIYLKSGKIYSSRISVHKDLD